ncbi:cd7 antigen-like [Salminus brasiliensis]|uniref:cd7 antigen-like n=1 Tax=Salminus brasiliensis TaxID=930266 RepID=UPI003B82DA46
MRSPLITVWLVVSLSATGFGDIVYFRRQWNTSVEFSCGSTIEKETPFAFSLERNWQKQTVLYLNFRNSAFISNPADKHRIFVQSDPGHQIVNVSINHLLGRHTDLYHCVFYYNNGGFKNQNGSTVFFLHVNDCTPEECRCNSYEPLLYSLSAAAVLLFLCVLVLAGAYCKRPASQPQPLAVPIYEEMNGVRTANGKTGTHHQGLYSNTQEGVMKTRNENPYNPLPGADPYSL